MNGDAFTYGGRSSSPLLAPELTGWGFEPFPNGYTHSHLNGRSSSLAIRLSRFQRCRHFSGIAITCGLCGHATTLTAPGYLCCWDLRSKPRLWDMATQHL